MSSRRPIPGSLVHSSANDYAFPEHARNAVNGNRTLPQAPPSSLPDSYEIPALRRKPVNDQTDAPAGRHSRSFSHPFPSLFGTKRTDKKSSDKPANDVTETQDNLEAQKDSTSRKQAVTGQSNDLLVKGSRQPVTGKCMTCDSTVRWPQDLKVFRCTTCLTINDLEPHNGQTPSDGGSNAGPVRRPTPVTIDRTRKIIDRCLAEYMSYILETESPPRGSRDIPREQTTFSDDEPSETGQGRPATSGRERAFLSTPRPRFEDRSPSDSRLATMKSQSREELRVSAEISRTPRKADPGSHQSDGRPSASRANSLCNNIFGAVENYIAGLSAGCADLNVSFFSIQPSLHKSERQPRRGQSTQRVSEANDTPASEPEVFLSELDAKMLLLGDVAENGSWWTGNQSLREEGQVEVARERSPDRLQGTVSAKTPRINWLELAEWYRLVIHAGDDWKAKWHSFCPQSSSPYYARWQSIPLERLHRDIVESQVHLQRSLLKSTENLLKRPRRPLSAPEDCRFLLILLANPLLHPSWAGHPGRTMAQQSNPPPGHQPSTSPTRSKASSLPPVRKPSGSLGHHSGIIKRILGLLANLPNDVHAILVSWFARFSDGHIQRLVDMIGRFVTYRLTRQASKPVVEAIDPTAGLIPSFNDGGVRHASQLHAAIGGRSNPSQSKKRDGAPKIGLYSEDWQIRVAARVMALLFQANTGHTARKRDNSISPEQRLRSAGMNAKHHAHVHGQVIPISNFYNTMLDSADLVADFETWENTKTKFTFCQYPFFLSIWAKIHVLEHDARRQMESKAREAFFDSILSRKAVSQYLVLKVRRDCLVEDSLKTVSEVIGRGGSDIKKGLRIDFSGEEGVDAGGLRKEWFLLLVREIFNPDHGLFIYDEESRYCYFNPFCFESSEQFFLVGVLLGLAIYNSTILDIAFPPFVFKKMLASAPPNIDKLTSTPKITHYSTLEDLAEFRPTLARGLRQLLDFEGDVQEVFYRDFVADMDRYGEIVQVPLCPSGEKRPVTNSNRREFVDLYVRYLLDTAVARQYEPFKRGFFTVCGGNALSLFRPEEIELLVRGSDEPLDVSSLQAVASYDGWGKDEKPEDQPPVTWFWHFFQNSNPANQRKILSFITGSDRIPAMGATNLSIRIHLLLDREADQSGQEPQRFPIARTCFNQLGLYRYHTQETLEHKLWMAVTESEGFGLK